MSNFCEKHWQEDLLVETRKMVRNFCYDHLPNAALVNDQLSTTGVHQSSVFWIRAQNAAVYIYREDANTALVTAWPLQPTNEAVMCQSAPIMKIPNTATTVPWERVTSVSFAQKLSDFARHEQPSTFRQASKKRAGARETREPNMPFLVFDELLAYLGGHDVDLGSPDRKGRFNLDKKCRDEVRYRNAALPWYVFFFLCNFFFIFSMNFILVFFNFFFEKFI